MLHRALADAVNWHYIHDNPATHARAPKVTRQRRTVWTPAELALFLAVAREDRFLPLFALASTTGMRRGELCGLRWASIDFVEGLLSVQDSRVVVAGRAEDSDGKTDSAGRLIALDAPDPRRPDRLAGGSG
jgi:integrase